MSDAEIKGAVRDILQEALQTLDEPQEMSSQELVDFHLENYCTVQDAIVLLENAGLARKNPLQQVHGLCNSGKVVSFYLGGKGSFRLIIKSSLEAWIKEKKEKGA